MHVMFFTYLWILFDLKQKAEHEKRILEARNQMMEMVRTIHKYYCINLAPFICFFFKFGIKKKLAFSNNLSLYDVWLMIRWEAVMLIEAAYCKLFFFGSLLSRTAMCLRVMWKSILKWRAWKQCWNLTNWTVSNI